MAGTRQVVISYGSFSTDDTYFQLSGVHSLEQDERTFTCSFTVVLQASSASAVQTAAATMINQLNVRHKAFSIDVGGTNYYSFADGVDGVSSGVEGAEFIQADWELLGSHRTLLSRAYRITVTVTRAANQPSKTGVYEQRIGLSTFPNGQRRMTFWAQFTPGPSDSETGTADDRYGDATYGFDALVTAIQTTLGGTWERTSAIRKAYDEDARTLTASSAWTELIYAQSASATNDTKLVGVRYDIKVDRKPAFTVPGQLTVAPFTSCSVTFSAMVDKSVTQDLDDVITTTVLPYMKNTVSRALALEEAPITMAHTLRASPTANQISGQVFYLAPRTTVIEVSKRVSDVARTGDTLVPVLDGGQWARDLHTGPGLWVRRVSIGTRVRGSAPGNILDALETLERTAAEGAGFRFTGWAINTSPSVEVFNYDGASITTTVQTRVLEFEYAEIRASTGFGGGGGGRVIRGAPVIEGEGGQGGGAPNHTQRERT